MNKYKVHLKSGNVIEVENDNLEKGMSEVIESAGGILDGKCAIVGKHLIILGELAAVEFVGKVRIRSEV